MVAGKYIFFLESILVKILYFNVLLSIFLILCSKEKVFTLNNNNLNIFGN